MQDFCATLASDQKPSNEGERSGGHTGRADRRRGPATSRRNPSRPRPALGAVAGDAGPPRPLQDPQQRFRDGRSLALHDAARGEAKPSGAPARTTSAAVWRATAISPSGTAAVMRHAARRRPVRSAASTSGRNAVTQRGLGHQGPHSR